MSSGGDVVLGAGVQSSCIPVVKIEGMKAAISGKVVFQDGLSLSGSSATCVLGVTDDGADTNPTSLQVVVAARATLTGKANCVNPRTGKTSLRSFSNEGVGRGVVCGALVFLKWEALLPEGAASLGAGTSLVFDVQMGPRYGSIVPGPRLVNAIVTDCFFGRTTPNAADLVDFLPGDELEDHESAALRISASELGQGRPTGWRLQLSALSVIDTAGSVRIGPDLVVTGDVSVVGPPMRYDISIYGSVLGNIVLPVGSQLGAVTIDGGLFMGSITGSGSCTSLALTRAHCPNWAPTLAPELITGFPTTATWVLALVDDGYYTIRNLSSGKALDVLQSGGAGAILAGWPFHGGTNQQFRLYGGSNGKTVTVPSDGAIVSLAPRHSPLLRANHPKGGAFTVQADARGAPNASAQTFQLRAAGGSVYSIHPLLETAMAITTTGSELLATIAVQTTSIIGSLEIQTSTVGSLQATSPTSAFLARSILGATTITCSAFTAEDCDLGPLTFTGLAGSQVHISRARTELMRITTAGSGSVTLADVAITGSAEFLPATLTDAARIKFTGKSSVGGTLATTHPGLSAAGTLSVRKLVSGGKMLGVDAAANLSVVECTGVPPLVPEPGARVTISQLLALTAGGVVTIANIAAVDILHVSCDELVLTNTNVRRLVADRLLTRLDLAGTTLADAQGLVPGSTVLLSAGSTANLNETDLYIHIMDAASKAQVNSDASIFLSMNGQPIVVKYNIGGEARLYIQRGPAITVTVRNETYAPITIVTDTGVDITVISLSALGTLLA
jgi:hypothetical protein